MKTCKEQIQSKNCGKYCTVMHYIRTENEQETILTHTININIQLYQSIHLTHLQAISSTVKSHNHTTLKKKAQAAPPPPHPPPQKKRRSSNSGGVTLDCKNI